MAKNTSIVLSEHFQKFVREQVASGKYETASEVVRDGLRLLEREQQRHQALLQALADGENSGPAIPLDREKFFRDAHRRADRASKSGVKAATGR